MIIDSFEHNCLKFNEMLCYMIDKRKSLTMGHKSLTMGYGCFSNKLIDNTVIIIF